MGVDGWELTHNFFAMPQRSAYNNKISKELLRFNEWVVKNILMSDMIENFRSEDIVGFLQNINFLPGYIQDIDYWTHPMRGWIKSSEIAPDAQGSPMRIKYIDAVLTPAPKGERPYPVYIFVLDCGECSADHWLVLPDSRSSLGQLVVDHQEEDLNDFEEAVFQNLPIEDYFAYNLTFDYGKNMVAPIVESLRADSVFKHALYPMYIREGEASLDLLVTLPQNLWWVADAFSSVFERLYGMKLKAITFTE